jgi:hypothetical protein
MSKSIRSFFVSKTVTVEEGSEPRKKAKIEAPLVEEATTIESSSTPSTAKDDDQAPALPASVAAPVTADVQIGWPPFDCMEPGWKAALAAEYDRPYFKSLLQFLTAESKTQTVYPPAKDLFSAFNLCPLDQVKVTLHACTGIFGELLTNPLYVPQVVVIGQDPYHGPDQAHGLAFSVRKGVAIPPSLKNMIIEARVRQGFTRIYDEFVHFSIEMHNLRHICSVHLMLYGCLSLNLCRYCSALLCYLG